MHLFFLKINNLYFILWSSKLKRASIFLLTYFVKWIEKKVLEMWKICFSSDGACDEESIVVMGLVVREILVKLW